MSEFIDYKNSIQDFLHLLEILEEQVEHYISEMLCMTHSHVRIEFFLEYKDEQPNVVPGGGGGGGVGGGGGGGIDGSGYQTGDLEEGGATPPQPAVDTVPEQDGVLEGIPNISSFIRQVDTAKFCFYLKDKIEMCLKPILKLKNAILEHQTQGNLPNLDSYSPCMKVSMCVFAELVLANLDMHPFSPKLLTKMLEVVNVKTGSWTIPANFQVELSEEAKAFSHLPFGVSVNILEKRIKISDIGNIISTTQYREKSRIYIQAQKMGKIVRSPFRFCESLENLQAVLSHFSTDENIELDYTLNVNLTGNHQDQGADRFFEHSLESRIDYNYIANELPKERRSILFLAITRISEALYNHCYHELLTCKKLSNARRSDDTTVTFPTGYTNAEDLPKSLVELAHAVYTETNIGNVLTWSIPPVNNEINNPGMLILYNLPTTFLGSTPKMPQPKKG
jgi:hypothetical protein